MELKYPASLQMVMDHLRNLPGVGRRTSERMAMSIYGWDVSRLAAFAETLRTLHERVGACEQCGNLAEATEDGQPCLCSVCLSPSRDKSQICVVEEVSQIRVIEASGIFHGVYHVLGGRIAPLEGKTPDTLTIPKLEKRLTEQNVKELILALSSDVEGQATAVYLSHLFSNREELRITRLAQGLPAGADMSYADPETMAAALSGRIKITNQTES